uniref:Immunoglobulin V-set domain-containing protein n=1 Tax=Micrurus lemniscatus lemniscatus TaxID=129467 RepID=A0A2D4J747_MICLE
MVDLREEVTIFCRSQDNFHGTFYLTRHQSLSDGGKTEGTKEAESNWTAFSLSHLSKSEGIYSCRFCLHDRKCSSFSHKIYLNRTGDVCSVTVSNFHFSPP